MKILCVIPARYDSTRLPGKPLLKIGGREMILRMVDICKRAKGIADVTVATDDNRILDVVREAGFWAIPTSSRCQSGTERVAEVMREDCFKSYEAVINVQGDEPLLSPESISRVAEFLNEDKAPRSICTLASVDNNWEEHTDRNVVKVVLDHYGRALYFSRSPVPHTEFTKFSRMHKHIGIYGYHRSTLTNFMSKGPCLLEMTEGLEQLRALYYRIPIQVIVVHDNPIGVDTPADLEKVRMMIYKEEGYPPY